MENPSPPNDMKKHYTEISLIDLPPSYLDEKGNFYLLPNTIGIHEEYSANVYAEYSGMSLDDSTEYIYDQNGYGYEFLEEIGFIRYCHWVGEFGKFVGYKASFQQKRAIKEFCKVNGCSWQDVIDLQ